MLLVMAAGLISPLYAQEAGTAQGFDLGELHKWSIITAGFALAIAAAFG
jgi:hypothetical protein